MRFLFWYIVVNTVGWILIWIDTIVWRGRLKKMQEAKDIEDRTNAFIQILTGGE